MSRHDTAPVAPGEVTAPLAPVDLPLEGPGLPGTTTFVDGDTRVVRTVLDSGVRVITQDVPATRSLALGLWMPVGSRDETPAHAGSTHFLEHLLFKGTPTRSALDIAVAFDAVGGDSNAETGKETTDYWARVLDEDAQTAVDVLVDMVTSSRLDEQEFARERGVILDELAGAEDSPGEVVHDAFAEAVHGDTPLGRPVGGTPEVIRALHVGDLWEHYRSTYTPDRLVVAAAGTLDHERLLGQVEEALGRAGWDAPAGAPRPRRAETPAPDLGGEPLVEVVRHRHVEQAHLVVGAPSMRAKDPRRPVMSVLLSLLGGSMSSRLFQEVREKRGLAYSTYAFDTPHADCGAFGMYATCAPDNVGEVETVMIAQLEDIAAQGPTQEELRRVRGQVRGALALGLEDTWSRMARLGRSEIQGRYLGADAALARIEAVTAEEVQRLAAELAQAPRRRAVVLPD